MQTVTTIGLDIAKSVFQVPPRSSRVSISQSRDESSSAFRPAE